MCSDKLNVMALFLGVVLFVAASVESLKVDPIDDHDDNSDAAAAMLRQSRDFGSDESDSSFPFHQNKQLFDWKQLFSGKTDKRSGEFGGYADFGKSNLQNWNKYFSRKYRSFMAPSQRSGGYLGFGTGSFGSDGLQNWRAFFDRRHWR